MIHKCPPQPFNLLLHFLSSSPPLPPLSQAHENIEGDQFSVKYIVHGIRPPKKEKMRLAGFFSYLQMTTLSSALLEQTFIRLERAEVSVLELERSFKGSIVSGW